MSSEIKLKKNNLSEDKFLYFIPCYDIISNEIFFSEFNTEKIISKPKNNYNKYIDNKKYQIIQNIKRKNKLNQKDIKGELKEKNYQSKIEKVNSKIEINHNNYNKKNKKRENEYKKEKLLLEEFALNWKKMKIISGFSENNYITKNYIEYFSRPLFSRFFLPQNLNLYSYNSTSPLSKSLSIKSYINIYIHYDIDNLFPLIRAHNDEYIINYIKSAFQILSKSPRQVSLFYIVDTLIKDSLKILENYILNLLDNLDNNYDLDEFIRNDSKNIINSDDDEIDLKEKEENINDEENKNMIYDYLIKIKKKLTLFKSNINNRFIFKFFDTEEYLYGNHTLGSNNYIRNKARQHESINLFLKYYPLYMISPPIMSYPPVIKILEKESTYENLFRLYIQLYPKKEIIYRFGKINHKQKKRYLKKEEKRTKYLIKFTESGDCDFPLKFRIKNLKSINSFKAWLNDEIYNNTELLLPYFNILKNNYIQKNNNFFSNIFSCCKKEEEIKDNNIKTKTYEDFIKNYNKNKKVEKELINKLNIYTSSSFYKNERYYIYNKILLNQIPSFINDKEQKNIIDKNEFKNKVSKEPSFSENYYFKDKFISSFKFDKSQSLFIPIYIKIKIYLLYGSFCIKKFYTQPYLLQDFILLNENIILDGEQCLISHLPKETRIGFTIKAFDSKLEKKFILGSCQIPLYNDSGIFNSGENEYQFWPNVKIFPRVIMNNCFSKKKKQKENFGNFALPILDADDDKIIKILEECKDLISPSFKKILMIEKEENELKEKEEIERYSINNNESEENEKEDNINDNDDNEEQEKNIEDTFQNKKNSNEIEYLDDFKNNYPSIKIELPAFKKPLIHSIKNINECKYFLDIKYKEKKFKNNDFEEVINLFANSQNDISNVMKSLSHKNEDNLEFLDIDKNDEGNEKDIFKYLKKTLPLLIKILKKDPLESLNQEEIKVILICRDYLSTIPSALELFLRSINWFNPLEVSIVNKYLKKWTKLESVDALSLLDSRFPDSKVRLYSIKILSEYPDEIIDNLMLMLCQCLLYENFLVNPLSDFLIERSLRNPYLIGTKFIWFNRVNMKNPIFEEKLSAYLLQFLMLCGKKFLNNYFDSIKYNYYLELFTHASKKEKEINKIIKGKKKKENSLVNYLNKAITKGKKIKLILEPGLVSYKFCDCISISNSDFIQSLFTFKTGENEDSPEKKVILRIGNDLRQDLLAIQILKLMDKLWLNNGLDLKLITYLICPSDIYAGYIEYVNYTELYRIQNSSGIIGVLDKEAIIKFLRGTGDKDDNNSGITENDSYESRIDNYIKSLAGYCVATCVLGITERSFRNVMIKNNGILLHINLGHLLGKFKYKCGIKTERSLFLLTSEMANVYISENKQEVFKKCCIKAFNILRHNSSKIINPFIIMSAAGLKDFYGINDINYIKKMLVLDKMNDEDAGNYFLEQIWKCKNEKLRQFDSLFSK